MVEKSVPTAKIYRTHLLPNWVAYVVVGLVIILTFLFLISMAAESASPEVVGIFCAGPIFVLPIIAFFFKGPPIGRVYKFGCSALALATTGLISAIVVALTSNEGTSAGVGLFFFITAPFSLILLIPLFFFLRQTISELREALYLNQVLKLGEVVEEKGSANFSELGVALNVAPSQIDNMIDELTQRQWREVTMYAPFQRVFSNGRLQETQQNLLTIVQERGQIYLDDLAIELQTPRQLITDWVYQHVHEHKFSGFINWETAVLYSTNAAQLRQNSRCPNCDGQLTLEGERIVCPYCKSEILMGDA